MKKPIIAIIANGPAPTKKILTQFLNDIDIIIAADGGANTCRKLGLKPDYIVGDLDSVLDSTLQLFNEASVIRMEDQDFSDMQKALTFAKGLNPKKIKIFAAFGERSDHTFSNLLYFASMNLPVEPEIFDNFGRFIILEKGNHEIYGNPGQPVSIISLTPVINLNLSGFKFAVIQENFSPFFNGTSNEFTQNNATITFDSGRLFVYFPFDKDH